MNKIDVSMIGGNPSNMFNTEHQELYTVTKRSSLDQHLQKVITPLPKRNPSQSQLTDSANKRKHRLFKQFREQSAKEPPNLGTSKSKIYFKIPCIDDYYIKQSKEHLLPAKVHRFQSLIEEPIKQEKKLLTTVRSDSAVGNQPQPIVAKQRLSLLMTCIIVLLVVSGCIIIYLFDQ